MNPLDARVLAALERRAAPLVGFVGRLAPVWRELWGSPWAWAAAAVPPAGAAIAGALGGAPEGEVLLASWAALGLGAAGVLVAFR